MKETPCEECRNIDTNECFFCSDPNYSKFQHRNTGAILIYVALAVLFAVLIMVMSVI